MRAALRAGTACARASGRARGAFRVGLGVGLAAAATWSQRQQEPAACVHRNFEDFYQLIENDGHLGTGSFGAVNAAVHKETQEVVAVKIIPRDAVTESEFRAEVDILRKAGEHKNIIQLTDVFCDPTNWYLVMEMAKGGELFDRIVNTEGMLTEFEVATIIKELAEAIGFLHLHGIVHGDLKPENILLADKSVDKIEVRLGDFGSATEVGGISGSSCSVAYSPPEVLSQNTADGLVSVSSKGDIWALGLLLYILLTGKHPYDANNDATDEELQERIMNGAVSFDDPLWYDVSPSVVSLLKQMLHRDPSQRPSALEVQSHPWFQFDPLRRHASRTHYSEEKSKKNIEQFCSGRRKLKALLLAVMVGLVDDSTSENSTGGSGKGSRTAACRVIDHDGKGYISPDDLRRMLELVGGRATDRDIGECLHAVDGDLQTTNFSVSYPEMVKLVPPICPAKEVPKHGTLYRQGELDLAFYLIRSGTVEFVEETPMGTVVLGQAKQGETFGEMELLKDFGPISPRIVRCRCVDPIKCELLQLDMNMFHMLQDVFPSVRKKIAKQGRARLDAIKLVLLTEGFRHFGREVVNEGECVWRRSSGALGEVLLVLEGEVTAISKQGKERTLRQGDVQFLGRGFGKELEEMGLPGKDEAELVGGKGAASVRRIPVRAFREYLGYDGANHLIMRALKPVGEEQ